MADTQAVQSSTDVASTYDVRALAAKQRLRLDASERAHVADARASLIDTRLVRVELARLRGPRPGTEIHRAGVVRSTLSLHA